MIICNAWFQLKLEGLKCTQKVWVKYEICSAMYGTPVKAISIHKILTLKNLAIVLRPRPKPRLINIFYFSTIFEQIYNLMNCYLPLMAWSISRLNNVDQKQALSKSIKMWKFPLGKETQKTHKHNWIKVTCFSYNFQCYWSRIYGT